MLGVAVQFNFARLETAKDTSVCQVHHCHYFKSKCV